MADARLNPSRRIDSQIALDVLARALWIIEALDAGEDGLDAAQRWDRDELLTDMYERFEVEAHEQVLAAMDERDERADPDARRDRG